jgi:hypothetical protein
MRIQFVRPDLHQIDHVQAETFVVCLFEDERPPRGVAGLLDWRLCGRLSNLLVEERLGTGFREAMLFPAYERLPVQRVCAYGLGSVSEFTAARAREASWFVADSLHRLRVRSFITALPGSPLTAVPARARMELFLEELLRVFGPDDSAAGMDVFIVEPAEAHRELTEVVSLATRKLRGMWK